MGKAKAELAQVTCVCCVCFVSLHTLFWLNFYSDTAAQVFPKNMFQMKSAEKSSDLDEEESMDEPEQEELPDSPE